MMNPPTDTNVSKVNPGSPNYNNSPEREERSQAICSEKSRKIFVNNMSHKEAIDFDSCRRSPLERFTLNGRRSLDSTAKSISNYSENLKEIRKHSKNLRWTNTIVSGRLVPHGRAILSSSFLNQLSVSMFAFISAAFYRLRREMRQNCQTLQRIEQVRKLLGSRKVQVWRQSTSGKADGNKRNKLKANSKRSSMLQTNSLSTKIKCPKMERFISSTPAHVFTVLALFSFLFPIQIAADSGFATSGTITTTSLPSTNNIGTTILTRRQVLSHRNNSQNGSFTDPSLFGEATLSSLSSVSAAVIENNQASEDSSEKSNVAFQRRIPDPRYVAFLDNTRFWVQRVLVPTITVIGVVGNTITIVIMTRRRMRSSTNWYLAALAITDMIYLIFTFILSLKHYPNARHTDYYFYWHCFPFLLMITDAASNSSVWLTVTFTIERYIAVCHPIRGKVICTESRAKKVIFCVFLICVSVTLPTPFEWVVIMKQDPITNATVLEAVESNLGLSVTYRNIYYQLSVFLFVVIPFVLLVVFNNFLIRSVHLSNKQRAQMVMAKDNYQPSRYRTESTASASTTTTGSVNAPHNNNNSGTVYQNSSLKFKSHASLIKSQSSSETPASNPTPPAVTHHQSPSATSRQEIRITIMLIAVVILFLVCQTPTAICLIYTTFHMPQKDSNEHFVLTALSNIFNFLMSIYAAGNFVLYCLLSQKYRRTFINMFCRCFAPARRYTTPSVCTRMNAMESVAGPGGGGGGGNSHTNASVAGRYLQVPSSFKHRAQRSAVEFSPFTGSKTNETNTCLSSRNTRSNNNNNNNNNNSSSSSNTNNNSLKRTSTNGALTLSCSISQSNENNIAHQKKDRDSVSGSIQSLPVPLSNREGETVEQLLEHLISAETRENQVDGN